MNPTMWKHASFARFFGLAFIFLLVSSLTMQAQEREPGSTEVSGTLGVGNYTSFGFAGAYNFNPTWAVDADYTYIRTGSGTELGYSYSSHVQSIGATARYSFVNHPYKILKPYVLFGGGVSIATVTLDGTSASGHGSYIAFGGGANIYLKNHWGVRPEVRWNDYSASGGYTNFQVTGTIFYTFGSKHK